MSTDAERSQDFLPESEDRGKSVVSPIEESVSQLLEFRPDAAWVKLEDGGLVNLKHVVRFEVGNRHVARYGLLACLVDGSEHRVVSGNYGYVSWYFDQLCSELPVFEVQGDYVSAEKFLEEA